MLKHWFDRQQNILKYQCKVVQNIQCVLEKSSGTVYVCSTYDMSKHSICYIIRIAHTLIIVLA